jgi:hypothetical protein
MLLPAPTGREARAIAKILSIFGGASAHARVNIFSKSCDI